MSGVVRGVKKAFRTVARVVKKIAKPVLVAAAIYFTAGLALSAFPATASFAASLPGFAGGGTLGLGIGAGSTAGTGIFTKLAAKFGMATVGKAGGLVGGAAAKGASVAALETAVGTKAAAMGVAKGVGSGAITGATAVTPSVGAALASPGAQAALAGGAATGTGATAAGLSLSEKLLLASTGTNFASGLMAPSPREVQEARTRWVGAFYGDEGNGPLVPPPQNPAAPPRPGMPGQGMPKPKIPSISPQRTVPQDVQAMRSRAAGSTATPQDTVDREYGFGGESLIPSATDPFESTQQ